MSRLRTQLSPLAVDAYHEYFMGDLLDSSPADADAVAVLIEAYDESPAVQKGRYKQLRRRMQGDWGKNAASAGVTALTVDVRGSSYAADDAIALTSSTGAGFVGTVTAVKGYASAIAINAAGTGYTAGEVLNVALTNGSGLTVKIDTVGGSGEATAISIVTDGTGLTENETGTVLGGDANLTIDVTVSLAGIDTVAITSAGRGYTTTDSATTITTTSGTGGTVTATVTADRDDWILTALDALIAA